MNNVMWIVKRLIKRFFYKPMENRHSLVGKPDFEEMKREFQISFLKQVGLEPQHYFIDIGCGTLRGGIPLIEYLDNGHYYGIEARKEVLDEGRLELEELGFAHKQPQLISTEYISEVSLSKKFEYIWAFSVLIHMKDEILNDTLRFVALHLEDKGSFYANVNIGNKRDRKWQGFPVVWRSLNFYEDACARNGLSVEDIGSLKDFGHITQVKAQDEQRMLKICRG